MTVMPRKANTAETALGGFLPSRRDEAWKWTDLHGRLDANAGGLTQAGLPKFTVPDGVSIRESLAQKNVASDPDHHTDHPMSALAASFAPIWMVDVPEGFRDSTPLLIENLSRGHMRIHLSIGAGARLDIVEHHKGDNHGFSNITMHADIKAGGYLNRTVIHMDPDSHMRVATLHATLWDQARFDQYSLSFGAAMARLETRLAGMGKTLNAHINGAYLLDGARHVDMTSYIDLAAPNSVIRQAVKGVVSDQARGVFQGKFHVRRPAQLTDAEMRHDALMLSERAEIRAKPELEIYADDVECAHGNTIGALDENALFYMRQRGIPLHTARALLTEAFVAGVFDNMSDTDLHTSVRAQIRTWLERRS